MAVRVWVGARGASDAFIAERAHGLLPCSRRALLGLMGPRVSLRRRLPPLWRYLRNLRRWRWRPRTGAC